MNRINVLRSHFWVSICFLFFLFFAKVVEYEYINGVSLHYLFCIPVGFGWVGGLDVQIYQYFTTLTTDLLLTVI